MRGRELWRGRRTCFWGHRRGWMVSVTHHRSSSQPADDSTLPSGQELRAGPSTACTVGRTFWNQDRCTCPPEHTTSLTSARFMSSERPTQTACSIPSRKAVLFLRFVLLSWPCQPCPSAMCHCYTVRITLPCIHGRTCKKLRGKCNLKLHLFWCKHSLAS